MWSGGDAQQGFPEDLVNMNNSGYSSPGIMQNAGGGSMPAQGGMMTQGNLGMVSDASTSPLDIDALPPGPVNGLDEMLFDGGFSGQQGYASSRGAGFAGCADGLDSSMDMRGRGQMMQGNAGPFLSDSGLQQNNNSFRNPGGVMPQQGMPGPSDNFRLSNPAGVGLIRNARMGGAVHQIGHSCGLGMQVPQQPQLGRQTQMQSRMHRVQQGSMQGQQIMSGVGNPFDTGLGPPGMVAGQGIQQGMSPNLMFGSEGQPVSGDVGMVAGGMRQEQQTAVVGGNQRLQVMPQMGISQSPAGSSSHDPRNQVRMVGPGRGVRPSMKNRQDQVHSGGMPGGPHQQVINMQSTMDLGMLDVMDSSIGFGVGGIGIGASALGMDMGFGMGMPGNGRILGKRGMSRIEEMREKRRLQGGQSLLKFMGETAPTLSVTGAAPPPDPPAGPGLGKGDAPSPISSMAPGDGRDEIETMPFAAGSGHVDTTGGITPAKDRAQAEDIVDAANLIQKQHGEGCARPEIKPGEDGARGQAGGHGQGALMEAAEDTSEVEISASAPEPKLDLTSKSEGDRRPEVVSAPSKATAIKRSNLELEKTEMTNEGCDKAENAVGEESTPAVAADAIENQTKGQNGLASIVCATEAAEPAMSSCDAKPSQVFVASPALPHGQGSAVNSPPNIGITNTPGTSSAVSCGQIGRPSSASPSFGQARNANCHFSLASGSQRQTVMRGMPSVTGSAQASQPSMGRLQGHAGGGGAMSQQTTVRMGQTYAATGMGHDQSSMRIEQLQKAMQGGMHGQVGPGRLLPGNSNGQGGMQHAFSTRMGVHGPQAGQQQPLVGVSRGSPMGPPKSGFQGASVSQLQGVPKQMLPNADFRPGAPRVMQQQPPPGRQPQQGDVNVMRSGRVVGMSGVGVRVSNGSAGMRSGPITDSFHMQWNQSGDMGQGAVLPNQQQQNMMAMQMQRQHRMQQQPQMQNQQRSDTMMFNSAGPSGMNGAGIAMLASSELEPIGCQSAGSSSIGEGPRISPRIQQGQQVQRPGQFDPPPVHMSSANTAAGRIFPCDSELFDSLGTTQQRIPLYQQQLQHDFGIGHQDLGSFANDSFLDDLPNIN